mgnify:CR=1 FL=1
MVRLLFQKIVEAQEKRIKQLRIMKAYEMALEGKSVKEIMMVTGLPYLVVVSIIGKVKAHAC